MLHSRWHRVVNSRIMSFLFCLPFANPASDSGDLYIDFDRNQLIFPVAHLLCQFDSRFNLYLPKHAYPLHITSHISCHFFASCCLCIAPCLIVGHSLVFFLWIEPGDEYVIEEPIEYTNEDQAFDNSKNFAGKMTIPLKSLLSLLC